MISDRKLAAIFTSFALCVGATGGIVYKTEETAYSKKHSVSCYFENSPEVSRIEVQGKLSSGSNHWKLTEKDSGLQHRFPKDRCIIKQVR